MSKNTTKHHYILPRSLCITILPPFSRNCGLFLLGDTYFCCYLGEKRCDTPFGFYNFCRIRLYITFMLAIVQSKFSFTCLEGWSWRSEDFSFGAILIVRRMEKLRARWSLPRWLLACLRLYVFADEIFCISYKNIQTTKVQTFTPRALCHSPTLNSFSCQRAFAPHSHNHYTSSPTTSHSPSSANITRHNHPPINTSSSYSNGNRKILRTRVSGQCPRAGMPRTHVLYHAPLMQP